jgi:hypothetical protein
MPQGSWSEGPSVLQFLSHDESQEWLGSFAVSINQNRALVFRHDVRRATKRLTAPLPEKPLRLTAFMKRVVDWLPRLGQRFLWISDWSTYPAHPIIFFETVRLGCGERRHIIDAPGCLFEPETGSVNQEFSEVPDTSTLIGFSLLVATFNWQAYLVTKQQTSHVHLGDDDISFVTTDDGKADAALELARIFDLKVTQKGFI